MFDPLKDLYDYYKTLEPERGYDEDDFYYNYDFSIFMDDDI